MATLPILSPPLKGAVKAGMSPASMEVRLSERAQQRRTKRFGRGISEACLCIMSTTPGAVRRASGLSRIYEVLVQRLGIAFDVGVVQFPSHNRDNRRVAEHLIQAATNGA